MTLTIMMTIYLSMPVKMILMTSTMNLPRNLSPHLAVPVLWTTLASSATMKKMSTLCKKNKKMSIMKRKTTQTTTFMPNQGNIFTDTTRDKRGPKKTSRRKKAIMRKIIIKSIRLHRLMPSHIKPEMWRKQGIHLNLYWVTFRRLNKMGLKFYIFRWSTVKERI